MAFNQNKSFRSSVPPLCIKRDVARWKIRLCFYRLQWLSRYRIFYMPWLGHQNLHFWLFHFHFIFIGCHFGVFRLSTSTSMSKERDSFPFVSGFDPAQLILAYLVWSRHLPNGYLCTVVGKIIYLLIKSGIAWHKRLQLCYIVCHNFWIGLPIQYSLSSQFIQPFSQFFLAIIDSKGQKVDIQGKQMIKYLIICYLYYFV